jgi:hypothetical protein
VTFVAATVLVAVIFFAVMLSVRRQVRNTAQADLESSQRMFAAIQLREQRSMRLQATNVAESPTLKAAVDTYAAESRSGSEFVQRQLLNTIREELAKVADRVEALRDIAELSDAVTLWSDPIKREAITLLQDRIRQVEDLAERCRGAFAQLHDAMFPLNPLPVGLVALLNSFRYGKDISMFAHSQIVAGAELALAFVRSHYKKTDFSKVATGPPVGKRKVTMMQVHYNAVKDTIVKQAPEYGKVMKGYEEASAQIREIESTLSLNPKANVDTQLRKLLTSLRDNVNTNYGRRKELVGFLARAGAPNLLYKLAGKSLSNYAPRGLAANVATGEGASALGALALGQPAAAAALGAGVAVSSPALVGGAAYGAGAASRLPLRKLGQASAPKGASP